MAGAGIDMRRFWRVASLVLVGFMAVCGVLVAIAAIRSDYLTDRQAIERIAAADEPCRAAFAKVADLEQAGAAGAAGLVEAGRAGEPVCRASFVELDRINIFIPSKGGSEARKKKAAIDDCAALLRARADLMAFRAAGSQDKARQQAVDAELERTNRICRASIEKL
jgi:hypothetical protein